MAVLVMLVVVLVLVLVRVRVRVLLLCVLLLAIDHHRVARKVMVLVQQLVVLLQPVVVVYEGRQSPLLRLCHSHESKWTEHHGVVVMLWDQQ